MFEAEAAVGRGGRLGKDGAGSVLWPRQGVRGNLGGDDQITLLETHRLLLFLPCVCFSLGKQSNSSVGLATHAGPLDRGVGGGVTLSGSPS